MSKRLTNAQTYMLNVLRISGPFDVHEMRAEFGRKWNDVWMRLESLGLVRFAWSRGSAKCYRVMSAEEDQLATTCFHCGEPAMPETHGFDPRCERHHDV